MADKAACVFVFAGTTEGQEFITQFHQKLKPFGCKGAWDIHVFVATEYGSELLQEELKKFKGESVIKIHTGRLDAEGMYKELIQYQPSHAVDCTHPHALEVSQNLKTACARSGCLYLRLQRAAIPLPPDLEVKRVKNLEEAAAFLKNQNGNILLTTGSRELLPFADPFLQNRIFIRVLPMEESIRQCRTMGFQSRNIIAMQGPFSEEMNRILIREIRASCLVTKDSGEEGGLMEKLEAARKEGIPVVMVDRPPEPEAHNIGEILGILLQDKVSDDSSKEKTAPLSANAEGAVSSEKHLYLIGSGSGGEAGMTGEARTAIQRSQCVIGAPRLIADVEGLIAGKSRYVLISPEEIIACIAQHEYSVCAVLFSGDSGFYSGAKKLIAMVQKQAWPFTVLPGVSSLSCFAARLGLSWEDVKVVSLHGRTGNILSPVMYHQKTFFLTGNEIGPAAICKALSAAGLGECTVHIGERLSYSDEQIHTGTAASLAEQDFDGLSVIMVENPCPLLISAGNYSLPDNAFIRGDIPMTKEEIRAVSLSKLRMEPQSIAWDIGAGTGSVACEMALKAYEGQVYAVEQDPKAVALINENRKKLRLFNLEAVLGSAPEILERLPKADRIFIGGSSGKLEPILEAVLAKNPCSRVVINAITLETVSEGIRGMKKYGFEELDIVQIGVSRVESAGKAHIMKALNPVFIISGSRGKQDG